jgi:hypothetical protein
MALRIAGILGNSGSNKRPDRDGRGGREQPEISPGETGKGRHDKLGVSPLAELEKALEGRESSLDRYRYLLLLRFALVNLVGFALLGAAHIQGWTDRAVASDSTGIVLLIFGLFVVGLVLCA